MRKRLAYYSRRDHLEVGNHIRAACLGCVTLILSLFVVLAVEFWPHSISEDARRVETGKIARLISGGSASVLDRLYFIDGQMYAEAGSHCCQVERTLTGWRIRAFVSVSRCQ